MANARKFMAARTALANWGGEGVEFVDWISTTNGAGVITDYIPRKGDTYSILMSAKITSPTSTLGGVYFGCENELFQSGFNSGGLSFGMFSSNFDRQLVVGYFGIARWNSLRYSVGGAFAGSFRKLSVRAYSSYPSTFDVYNPDTQATSTVNLSTAGGSVISGELLYPIAIFGSNFNGRIFNKPANNNEYKFSNLSINRNGVIVADFKCVIKNRVVGIYDTVQSKFYPPIDGTFTYGSFS